MALVFGGSSPPSPVLIIPFCSVLFAILCLASRFASCLLATRPKRRQRSRRRPLYNTHRTEKIRWHVKEIAEVCAPPPPQEPQGILCFVCFVQKKSLCLIGDSPFPYLLNFRHSTVNSTKKARSALPLRSKRSKAMRPIKWPFGKRVFRKKIERL